MSGDLVTLVGGEELSDDPTAPVEHVAVVVPRAPMDREREFTEFMLEATPVLARTAWLLCGDEHRAEELVQQALMRTFVSWSTARERDPLAYTRRTLANLRVDTWRKHRREVLTPLEGLPHLAPIFHGAWAGRRAASSPVLIGDCGFGV
jgi:DNA-directed RNA polymerase specialized sigma24 family protein